MTLHIGDCLDVLPQIPDHSIDAVVTDPPYAIGILDRDWDKMTALEFERWTEQWAAECRRVLKPGAYLAAFGSPRTFHRLAAGIEDAGLTIRDTIAWLHVQGFPPSLDVSEAVEAYQAGLARSGETSADVTREGVLTVTRWLREARNAAGWTNKQIDALFGTHGMAGHWTTQGSQPAVPRVEQWDQLRDALGFDDTEIRPLVEQLAATRTWAGGHGTPKSRLFETLHSNGQLSGAGQTYGTRLKPAFEPIVLAQVPTEGTTTANVRTHGTGALHLESDGKFPANVTVEHGLTVPGLRNPAEHWPAFKFHPKAPAEERPEVEGVTHPTVKALGLVRWLVDLITPPGGRVLDPFAGSGSTGVACIAEGRDFVLIEREPEHAAIIRHRLAQPIQTAFVA